MIAQPNGDTLELWSSTDIRRHYGITRQTLMRWRAMDGFPDPLKAAAGQVGAIWDAAAIRRWKRAHDAVHSTRKAGLVSAYLRMDPPNLAAFCRRHRIPVSTMRGWLHEGGHLDRPTDGAS